MSIIPQTLAKGILVPTLTPFGEDGKILFEAVTDQARRLSVVTGVLGIAVNTALRERGALSTEERLEIVRRTRAGLPNGRVVLSFVGPLCDAVLTDVLACQAAGADAIICVPAKPRTSPADRSFEGRLASLVDLIERLVLPVIIAIGDSTGRWATERTETTALARSCSRILGFDMGADDDVVQYDQDYYALKSVDRPLACLPSSEGALFHNLTTGADGVLSCLAYVAPHEISALYKATRENCFPEARAIHNQLAPLIALLNGHDAETREMIYREAAHHRGLLPSADARGIGAKLSPELRTQIHQTIADIGLKTIAWI